MTNGFVYRRTNRYFHMLQNGIVWKPNILSFWSLLSLSLLLLSLLRYRYVNKFHSLSITYKYRIFI